MSSLRTEFVLYSKDNQSIMSSICAEFESVDLRRYTYVGHTGINNNARKMVDENDYQNLMKELREESLSVNAAINYSCYTGNLHVLKSLINEFDYDITYEDNLLLKISATSHKYNIINFLLENGANVCAGNNIAIKVMSMSYPEMINRLIDYGANIHVDNEYPLRCSAWGQCYDNMKLLLEHGANIHADDDFVLRICCYYGDYEIIKFLLERGANVHANNDYPLMITTRLHSCKYIKLLLESGATVNAEILGYAICDPQRSSAEIVKLLLDYCNDIGALNNHTITLDKETEKIVELVASRGISLEKILMTYYLKKIDDSN